MIFRKNKIVIQTNTEGLDNNTSIVSLTGEDSQTFIDSITRDRPPVSEGHLFNLAEYTNRDLLIALNMFYKNGNNQ
ncbi:MAG: hypothetical protein ACRDBG_26000 [Waterburya sp.]